MKRILSIALAAMLLITSCAVPQKEKPVEILISAAASLTDCVGELKTIYEKDHADVTIIGNFGSSGALQQQIEQGAPADIFFSAGKKQMKVLQDGGLMNNDSVKDSIENKVVLITKKDGAKLTKFEELAGAGVKKIAVGEPQSVPVGQYTAEVFETLGLTDTLKDKFVYAKDVREVLAWVETGNVDAGVVYETDAKISDKVQISCTAPEESHEKVVYPVGVVKSSGHAAQAQAFVDFLFTPEAKEVFIKYGFTVLNQ